MKKLFTLFILSILCVSSIQAQFTYTGGPEELNTSQIVGIGDTLMTVVDNQVFFKQLATNSSWQPLSQGLFGKDTAIITLCAFKHKFFILQGNSIFFLETGTKAWQQNLRTIYFENVPKTLISLDTRVLLLNTYNKAEGRYFFYQYNETLNEWTYVKALDNGGYGAKFCITPNGNIITYVERFYGIYHGVSLVTRALVVFDANTDEWSSLGENRQASFNNMVAFSDSLVLGAGMNGVAKSRDGGKNWTFSNLLSIADPYLYYTGNTLYAVGTNGIAQSRDTGQTWIKIDFAAPISKTTPFAALDTLFWAVVAGVPYQNVNGTTTAIQLGDLTLITNTLIYQQNLFVSGLGGIFKLAINSTEPAQAESFSAGLPNTPQFVHTLSKAGTDFISIAGSGFYTQAPGQKWALSTNGIQLKSRNLLHRGLSAHQDTFVIFGETPTYYSLNRGKSWQSVPSPSNYTMIGFANFNQNLIAGFPEDQNYGLGTNHLYQWEWKKLSWQKINTDQFGMLQFGMKKDTILKQSGTGRWLYSQTYRTWTDLGYLNMVKLFSLSNGIYGITATGTIDRTAINALNANGTRRELIRIPDSDVRFMTGKDSLLVLIPTPPPSPEPNLGFVLFSSNLGKTWKKLSTSEVGIVNTALFDNNQLCLGGSNGVWCAPLSNLLTGIKEPLPIVSNALKVFPNPGKDYFQIQDPQKLLSGNVIVNAYNLQGQLIRQWKENVFNFSLKLDFSQEQSGSYWLVINDGKRIWVSKIMKI